MIMDPTEAIDAIEAEEALARTHARDERAAAAEAAQYAVEDFFTGAGLPAEAKARICAAAEPIYVQARADAAEAEDFDEAVALATEGPLTALFEAEAALYAAASAAVAAQGITPDAEGYGARVVEQMQALSA